MTGYAWDTSFIQARLASDIWPAECVALNAEMQALRTAWDALAVQKDGELVGLLESFLALDRHYERQQSILDLARLMGVSVPETLLTAWDTQTDRLSELCGAFIEAVLQVPSSTWQTPALQRYAAWVQSLAPMPFTLPDPVSKTLRRVGGEYVQHLHSQTPLTPEQGAEWLAQRVEIDSRAHNVPWSYALRCWDNGLPIEPFKPSGYTAAHRYFTDKVRATGHVQLPLHRFRQDEADRINQHRMSADEAIGWIEQATEHPTIKATMPQATHVIQQIVQEQRLQLNADDNTHPLCVDTPYGSYVQVYFDGSVFSLMSLAHELGHAIHHAEHRHEKRASPDAAMPLPPLVCEQRAIGFERQVIAALLDCAIPTTLRNSLTEYLTYQTIELGQRHAMLHAFEADLYRLPRITAKSVSDLWLTHNRAFYGPSIHIDDTMAQDWCDVQHLFTAPFYLQLYVHVMMHHH
ncbi:hypothetical protein ACFOSD_06070 [Salinispirillum marinum]|uniref:Peptidase M3A/M3B catalytic domain-containing protein n=2 Tax=Saccharospirillaceae TaxID=255527 RepID=A0ABV8BEW1_9GAMM